VKAATVSGRALLGQIIFEGGRPIEGVDQRMYVAVSYPDGTPARATVSLQGHAASAQTDETGVAVLPAPSGHATVVACDAAGNKAEIYTSYPYESWHEWSRQNFLIRPDQATYKPGGRAKIVILSATDGVVYLDLVKSSQTVLAKSVEVKQGKGELTLDLPLDLSGTVRFTGYRIQDGGNVVRTSRLAVIERPDDLRIRAVAAKEEFRPGEDIDLSFEVTDSSGRPAPSALGLSVVDEAVFALQETRPGFEKTFFQIEEELLRPRGQLKPLSGLTPARLAAAGQPQVTPLASISYVAKAGRAYRTARDLKEVGFIGLVVLLAAGFLATLFWTFYRARQGSWSGLVNLLCFACLALLVGAIAIPGLLSSQRASNERSAATRAKALEAEAAAMAAAASDPSAPRIREHFPETLYWNPEVITDEKGRASLRIPGADSITTWRMSMSAITRAGKLGAGDHPLRVFQPFFVDLDLPVSLTQGDEVWLPVAVHNYLKERQKVALTLVADDGLELADDPMKSVSVEPGEVTNVRFHLRARRFGRHGLQVKAVGPSFSDAVRRSVDVLPDGKEIPVSICDRLHESSRATVTIPETSVDGATRLWVRIFPSTFSELVTGLEGMIRMPYG
jgi:CD109 antigen